VSGVEHVTVAAAETGMRLDRWFRTHYPQLGHGALQKLLRKGQVRVDGGRAKANERLAAGQKVRVPPMAEGEPKTPAPRLSQDDIAFIRGMIMHRDDHVIALNKPSGLAVQGGTKTQKHLDALLDGLMFDASERPRLVHRLDKDTSGVLLLGRTRAATTELARVFRTRSARKIYWALVHGVPRPAQGKIVMALKKTRGPQGDRVRAAGLDEDEARNAITYYAVIAKAGSKYSWLSVKPVTGRTHQIRAHLVEIGHPIVGDPKYGQGTDAQPEGIENGLHLHARRLTLPHPAGGTLDVTAPLPDHMRKTWKFLGLDEKVDFEPLENVDT
jgi:23S rRNA pseudouridine955/2504/2580 synthase